MTVVDVTLLMTLWLGGIAAAGYAAHRVIAQQRSQSPSRPLAWRRFGETRGLEAHGEARWRGEVDGMPLEITKPLDGWGPFATATVFTVCTDARGLEVVRQGPDAPATPVGHGAFDARAQVTIEPGAHHHLTATLRDVWLEVDSPGAAQILANGHVRYIVRGDTLPDDELAEGLRRVTELARARAAVVSPASFLATPEPASLLMAALDALAASSPDEAREAAKALGTHANARVRVAACALLGADELLACLDDAPALTLQRLPASLLSTAMARLPDLSLPERLWAISLLAARRIPEASEAMAQLLADGPRDGWHPKSIPLFQAVLDAWLEHPVPSAIPHARAWTEHRHGLLPRCVELLSRIGTIDDVALLQSLPTSKATTAAIAAVQQRHGGVAGAVSIAPETERGRLAVASRREPEG